jgi:hypothetical protein
MPPRAAQRRAQGRLLRLGVAIPKRKTNKPKHGGPCDPMFWFASVSPYASVSRIGVVGDSVALTPVLRRSLVVLPEGLSVRATRAVVPATPRSQAVCGPLCGGPLLTGPRCSNNRNRRSRERSVRARRQSPHACRRIPAASTCLDLVAHSKRGTAELDAAILQSRHCKFLRWHSVSWKAVG